MGERTMKEYQELKRQLRDKVDDSVNNGLGRVAAIREMFEYAVAELLCDPVVWFPGYAKAIEKSNYQTAAKIAKLVGYPYKDVMYGFSSLLLMGQVTNKFNRKEWVVMPRAAKYMPHYYGATSKQLFYPFTALMIEAYLRTQSPKAWNTRECTFGIRKQEWFEEHSNAYKNILSEFGAAALPGCFVS